MRFEVPQYIDVEDKIFGPLTWRQFLYLGGGLGMAVAIFLITPIFIFIILGIPIAIIAGALAFYPVNSRPFSYFLEAFFTYFKGQHLYLWHQKDSPVHYGKTEKLPITPIPNTAQKNKRNVASLARQLELQALQKDN